jgi:uncharacterized membrane protein YedE/YeeE
VTRVAGGLIGIVFGVVLSWSAMSDPAVVRKALLFEQSYMFLFFASAMATAVIGVRLVRRYRERAVLTGGPIGWTPDRPERRHVAGAAVFGLGWGLTGACPGPIATQIGQGVPWALFILTGVVAGVYLFLRRSAIETEPAADAA